MEINVTGIIINGIMLMLILILIIVGFIYNRQLKICENDQSLFCFSVQCPCDRDANDSTATLGPCFGFAFMPGPGEGQYYCSNSPLSLVDAEGNLI